jgi:hypothetical protein
MAAKNAKWENDIPDLNTVLSFTSCSLPQQKNSHHKLGNSDLCLKFWNVTSFA